MTTRNLNGNWIDTLRRQYVYDLRDGVAHPIKYLLWNPQKGKDIYYEIASPIDEPTFRKSLVKHHQATKGTTTVEWENEYIKVSLHPRYTSDEAEHVPPEQDSAAPDEPPVPGHQDSYDGTTDEECQDTANPHECFRISNMGNCELYLHATADDCEAGESEQFYDAGNEDEDISPDFQWDSWSVLC